MALLGCGEYERVESRLGALLDAWQSPALQLQIVRAFERLGDPREAKLLIQPQNWTRYTPQIRAAVISTLTSKPPMIEILFGAIKRGEIQISAIPSVRRTQLLQHANLEIRRGAETIFRQGEVGDRMEIFRAHSDILKYPADAARGAGVFVRVCSACHSYNGAGGIVGPDLTGVRNQSAEAQLLHILVPNHEISPGY